MRRVADLTDLGHAKQACREADLWAVVKRRHGRVQAVRVFDLAREHIRAGRASTLASAIAEAEGRLCPGG